jgi:hypothetical protein
MARFAVLSLERTWTARYVIYDRATQRIVDGVYSFRLQALDVAAWLEMEGEPVPGMTPNADALGLLFPKQRPQAAPERS